MGRILNVKICNNDQWLTPLKLIEILGCFDLDPCCTKKMPWSTAKKMLSKDGLTTAWKGRVFINPPYSNLAPWVAKFIAHRNGIMLFSASCPGAPWSQDLLSKSDAIYYLRKKLKFYRADGSQASAYLYNVLYALGQKNVVALRALKQTEFNGVLLRRLR